jgi:hypothetical protein
VVGLVVGRAVPMSVMREPAMGSASVPVPSISRLARASPDRFLVCKASVEMRNTGLPSGSVAVSRSDA